MANPEHLEILKQGVDVWNQWRKDNPYIQPNLGDSIMAWFFRKKEGSSKSELSELDLNGADFNGANLSFADFSNTKLRRAQFRHATLMNIILKGADLWGANFFQAFASGADFSSAILISAELRHADLSESDLSYADLSNAYMGHTILERCNLSSTRGLDSIIHDKPSIIGLGTLYETKGNLPSEFMRGCGVPEAFIVNLPVLIDSVEPYQFYSCFISYSSKDQDFANRLYADLQNKGVRCWFAPEDLKIGAEIRTGIDESIRVHDKLLLVLSETSVKSQWVQQEVETALAKEREQGRTVLFPIRLDDTVMEINTGWPAYLKNARNIGDFREWRNHDSYQKAFDRLLRDLKADDSISRNPLLSQ